MKRLTVNFAEQFDVGGPFLERAPLPALHQLADLFDDVRIRQRGDVPGVHTVGNGRQHPAHNLAGARLRHVWNDVNSLRPGDFADHCLDRRNHLVDDQLVRYSARLDGNIEFRNASFDFVDDGNDGRLRHFGHGEAGRFNLFGAEAVAGNVDYVVHAPKNAEVAVAGKQSAVAGEVRPVAPILARRILAILRVVLLHEAVGIAPDSLHDARPGVAYADVSRRVIAGFDFLAVLVPDDGVNAEGGRARASGLHGVESGLGGAEKPAGFGLPPGVHNYGFALAANIVIPAPDFRLDGFAHGRHVLEVVVILGRFIRTRLAKHANGSRRGMEDVDVEALCDAPGAAGIRELRNTFVEDAGCRESKRPVDDVGMTGDPADV